MTEFVADVRVMLKTSVNDPQGQSIRHALRTLGFETVADVRAGKLIHVRLEAEDQASATALVQQMGDKLLANPVIETFEFSVCELTVPTSSAAFSSSAF
jgi:phosphoribosylformylglycinamidine synthase PurS subunit